MKISVSNVLINLIPGITNASTDDAANISSPNHSLNYTSGGGVGNFAVSYGAHLNISYVAISGHNAATINSATVQLFDGATMLFSMQITRNNNIMFTFAERSFTDLIVKFITIPNTYQMTVSFIAAGKAIDIPRGEQGGYKRQWLNRSTTQRTVSTFEVAPIGGTQKSKALKGVLMIPDSSKVFSEDEWQDFIDFSFEQPFFIKEQNAKPQSSYICYDPKFDIASHAQTLDLNVLSLKFTLYNGL
jgi:hypothetical protein